ncbi:MAG: pyridoxal phosphate-dependent aminotransferase [Deltaproteobacteria bacterium]|nr:MAG: pyridoxal phosphate-dependent aminotransferase [Deltaproteobacteria bacterium]
MKTARRTATLGASATVAITSRAKALVAEGVDLVTLSAGEPDFAAPGFVLDATVEALRAGHTSYAPVGGVPALRDAVAERFTRDYGVPFTRDQVIVTVGGKEALYDLFQVLVDPGDEVIVPAPYWVSYPTQIAMAGGRAVTVPCDASRGHALDIEALKAALTTRTVGVVLNSPNNPSGAVYDAESLGALADLAVQHDLWIISDDIYSAIRYDDTPFTSILHVRPELRERVFIVHGVAKTWAMTGFRVGFLAGSRVVLGRCMAVQSQTITSATTFAQHGALAAITGDDAFLGPWLAAYDARRRLVHAALEAMPGVRCALPSGAFYAFPDMRGLLDKRHRGDLVGNDRHLAELLLERAHVAVVPGSAFGSPGFLRLSYACATDRLALGLERIAAFVAELS